VTLGLCNITAKLPSEGLCSWITENRSVAPKGDRGPSLKNPVVGIVFFIDVRISKTVSNTSAQHALG